jgi:hypothetical protein
MHFKALMETCCDLKSVQGLISNFDKGEKDEFFDILKVAKDLQQARSTDEVVSDLNGRLREVIKPVQETVTVLLQQIVQSDSTMVEYVWENTRN